MRPGILALILAVTASPAWAQSSATAIRRVDLGFGAASAVVPHRRVGLPALQTRVGVDLTGRSAFEAVADVVAERTDSDPAYFTYVVYTIQGRYALRAHPGRLTAFLTYGGSGAVARDRRSERYRPPNATGQVNWPRRSATLYPPLAPTAGVAFQYVVSPRIAVRMDMQAIVCPLFDSVGLLTSASISVPIGSRYQR